MKIWASNLNSKLKQALSSLYLVTGDEPLQIAESSDSIRQLARKQGFTERDILHVESGFDWQQLVSTIRNMSIFSDKKLVELRMQSGKPGVEGSKVIAQLAEKIPKDVILIIITGKLEASSFNTKWAKAVDQYGIIVQATKIDAEKLPQWIAHRLQAKGIIADKSVVKLMAERVEGNMLAAAQEIEKLLLLYGAGKISFSQAETSIVNSSRFDVYLLTDAAMSGYPKRVINILNNIRHEGIDPVLILWALTREIRQLMQMKLALNRGEHISVVSQKFRVWDKRKPLVNKCLGQHHANDFKQMLQKCFEIDCINKGAASGDAWNLLLGLCMQLTGIRSVVH